MAARAKFLKDDNAICTQERVLSLQLIGPYGHFLSLEVRVDESCSDSSGGISSIDTTYPAFSFVFRRVVRCKVQVQTFIHKVVLVSRKLEWKENRAM